MSWQAVGRSLPCRCRGLAACCRLVVRVQAPNALQQRRGLLVVTELGDTLAQVACQVHWHVS